MPYALICHLSTIEIFSSRQRENGSRVLQQSPTLNISKITTKVDSGICRFCDFYIMRRCGTGAWGYFRWSAQTKWAAELNSRAAERCSFSAFPLSLIGLFCFSLHSFFHPDFGRHGKRVSKLSIFHPSLRLCSLMNYSLSWYKLCSLAHTGFRTVYTTVCLNHHPPPPLNPTSYLAPPCCWVTEIDAAGLTPADNRWVVRDVGRGGMMMSLLYRTNTMFFTQLCLPAHLIIFPLTFLFFFQSKTHLFKEFRPQCSFVHESQQFVVTRKRREYTYYSF